MIWTPYNIVRENVEIVFTMVNKYRKNIDTERSIKLFCSHAGNIFSVRKVLPETDLPCPCMLAGAG